MTAPPFVSPRWVATGGRTIVATSSLFSPLEHLWIS